MVICEQHKFIFVHVFRTGGTSIDRAFHQWALPANETHKKLEDVPGWEDYFSFGVVRNPWDRTLSGYKYQSQKKQFIGAFEQYIERFASGRLSTAKRYAQYDMLKNCSYIIRFEHLQQDFEEVCSTIGVDVPPLPHMWKTEHKPYTEAYTDEMKQILHDASIGDIEEFGFSFDSTATKNIRCIKC